MDNSKETTEHLLLLSHPENPSEPLVSVVILKDQNGTRSLTIDYNPNYTSQNGMVSYEWTKQELLDLVAKLD
jgi:hypothetical protein